jgi:O-antigen/teichoic acid export membrane protein
MRLAGDAAIVGASHLASALCIVGVQVVLARTLPAEKFGALLVAQALALLVEGLVVARAGEVATFVLGRAWPKSPAQAALAERRLRALEWRWGLGALAGFALAAPFLELVFDASALFYVAFGAAIALQSGFGTSKAVFIVTDHVRAQAWFELGYSASAFVATSAAVATWGVNGFLGAAVVLAICKAEAARRITRAWVPAAPTHEGPLEFNALSMPSLLRNAFTQVANQGDVLILGLLAPKESVALYKVSRTLATVPGRAAGPLWSVLRPRFVRHLGTGQAGALRREVVRPATGLAIAGVVAAPLALMVAAPALDWIYGPAYAAAASVMLILLVGNWLLAGVTGWLGTISIMSADKRVSLGIYSLLAIAICGGSTLAAGDLVMTATAVATAMAGAAVLAWGWLWVSFK